MIQGKIIRVAGPVVDVQFTAGRLPALQEALTVTAEGTERTMEVAQHVNESTVRCIMLSASEGLGKGMEVTATGHGIAGDVIDECSKKALDIHAAVRVVIRVLGGDEGLLDARRHLVDPDRIAPPLAEDAHQPAIPGIDVQRLQQGDLAQRLCVR